MGRGQSSRSRISSAVCTASRPISRSRRAEFRGAGPQTLTTAIGERLEFSTAAEAPEAAQSQAAQSQAAQSQAAQSQAAQWQQAWREPLNCSIVFTDVAGCSDPVRTDGDRDVVRAAMYEILRSAFEASGVPWAACYREDRGDGAVIVVPPTISTLRAVDPLVAELAARLRQYNRRASEVVRIQLRVALHVGPVGKDAEGLTGQAIISAARIVDAPVIKARLAAEQADLVFAASDYVYDHVVRNCGGQVDPAAFEHMECQVKESYVSAWVHLAGRVVRPAPSLSLVPPPSLGPLPVRPRRWASSRPRCAAGTL